MPTRKSSGRKGRFVSLRVLFNFETNTLKYAGFIETKRGWFVRNPIRDMLKDNFLAGELSSPTQDDLRPKLTPIEGGRHE